MTWRVLDLFSGIGAFSLGLERAGMKTVAFCEIDAFCQRVLAKHWPTVACHDDVTTRKFIEGEADVICGGFPCQDLSGAGKRAGLSGTRSGLYRELVRAIRVVRPRVAILENVAALLSGPSEDPGGWFHEVLGDLAESGACIEWDSVSARSIGACHERERVWIVAHADDAGFGPEPLDAEMARPQEPCGGGDAADAAREPLGPRGQPWGPIGVEPSVATGAADADCERGRSRASRVDGTKINDGNIGRVPPDASGLGCRQGRPRRPPDSFARVRDETRRNAADPYGARLAFREGFTRDAFEKLTPAERDRFGNERQSIWPDEPALQGVDDGSSDWVAEIRATGNCVIPQIPEMIAIAIMSA